MAEDFNFKDSNYDFRLLCKYIISYIYIYIISFCCITTFISVKYYKTPIQYNISCILSYNLPFVSNTIIPLENQFLSICDSLVKEEYNIKRINNNDYLLSYSSTNKEQSITNITAGIDYINNKFYNLNYSFIKSQNDILNNLILDINVTNNHKTFRLDNINQDFISLVNQYAYYKILNKFIINTQDSNAIDYLSLIPRNFIEPILAKINVNSENIDSLIYNNIDEIKKTSLFCTNRISIEISNSLDKLRVYDNIAGEDLLINMYTERKDIAYSTILDNIINRNQTYLNKLNDQIWQPSQIKHDVIKQSISQIIFKVIIYNGLIWCIITFFILAYLRIKGLLRTI